MDHQEKHHEHHKKEREHEIHAHHQGKSDPLPFHPAWLVVFGTVLILVAIAIWTFLVW
jgi:hypothetical protein